MTICDSSGNSLDNLLCQIDEDLRLAKESREQAELYLNEIDNHLLIIDICNTHIRFRRVYAEDNFRKPRNKNRKRVSKKVTHTLYTLYSMPLMV